MLGFGRTEIAIELESNQKPFVLVFVFLEKIYRNFPGKINASEEVEIVMKTFLS